MFDDPAYLDALFTTIRAFTDDLSASKRWLARAEATKNQAWRLSFLLEARTTCDRAPVHLTLAAERLAELGSVRSLPAPLDRIHENFATMRADLAAHEESLRKAEASEASNAIGRA